MNCCRNVFTCLVLLLATCQSFAELRPSVREELEVALAKDGIAVGMDRKAKTVVAIGVSSAEKDPDVVAHMNAIAEISRQLNGGSVTAMRFSKECDGDVVLDKTIKRVTDGYVIGVEELHRVCRRAPDGRREFGVALKWSLTHERRIVEALKNPPQVEITEVITALEKEQRLVALSGPQIWYREDGGVYLLGIGVCRVEKADALSLKQAIRLAKVKAEKWLSLHFFQYSHRKEVHDVHGMISGALRSEQNSLPAMKSQGFLDAEFGVSELYSDIMIKDGESFAVSVVGLTSVVNLNRKD